MRLRKLEGIRDLGRASAADSLLRQNPTVVEPETERLAEERSRKRKHEEAEEIKMHAKKKEKSENKHPMWEDF